MSTEPTLLPNTKKPLTFEELTARVAPVAQLAAERAAQAEAQGKVTEDVFQALDESLVFGMWAPQSLGGSELTFSEGLRLVEQVSYGDAAAGWLVLIGGVIGAPTGAYMGDEAVRILFQGDRFPFISGQGTRPGKAVPEGDGYRVTGEWNFGSGIHHAQWTHSLAIDSVTGAPLITTTPIADAQLDYDSWNVIGLKASGSLNYSIDGAFVPKSFTHDAFIAESSRGGWLYNMGLVGFAVAAHTGWAFGVGRRLLDELKATAAAKAGRAGAVADSDSFQEQYFAAELRLRSARALALEAWRDVEETLQSGAQLSLAQQTLVRGALVNATLAAKDVAEFVFATAGTASVRPGTIQRAYRDVLTGASHMHNAPAVRRQVGRVLAGFAEGHHWVFQDLVPPAAV